MKTLFAAIVIVAVAGSAVAGVNTDKPMGPLDLVVNPDGTGYILNAGAEPFGFDGYTIESVAVALGDLTGIFDNTVADMVVFPGTLGLTMSEALAWTEMSKTADNYSEVTMDKVATLQPGGMINLGAGMMGLTQQNGTFTYVDSTQVAPNPTSFEGDIVPEPATMSLLGLGAIALIRRRR